MVFLIEFWIDTLISKKTKNEKGLSALGNPTTKSGFSILSFSIHIILAQQVAGK